MQKAFGGSEAGRWATSGVWSIALKRPAQVGIVWAMLCGGSLAYAHHGRDFLFSQTADLPHPGELYLLPRQDFTDEGDVEEVEFEPTILFGAAGRLALEVHAHIAKEGGDPLEHESTAGVLHFRITPPESSFRVGVSAEYELSNTDALEDRIEFRFVVSKTLPGSILALNIVADEKRQDREGADGGYSIGFRREISGRAAWGIEAQGILEESEHEVLVGLYFDPTSRFTVNVGAGTGLGDSEVAFSVRTALVWRLGRVGGGRSVEAAAWPPAYSMNPAAGGKVRARSSVGRTPTAGHAER